MCISLRASMDSAFSTNETQLGCVSLVNDGNFDQLLAH